MPSTAGCWQPTPVVHTSAVHNLPSSQLGAPDPPAHTPPLQPSPNVQGSPSSQVSPLASCVQPVLGLQSSAVHSWPSSQGIAVPLQMPPAHVSLLVQALLSSHDAVF